MQRFINGLALAGVGQLFLEQENLAFGAVCFEFGAGYRGGKLFELQILNLGQLIWSTNF